MGDNLPWPSAPDPLAFRRALDRRRSPSHTQAVADDDDRDSPTAPTSKTTTYGLSRLAPPIRLVDAAAEIEKADLLISSVAGSKLRMIAEQIRALQEQAQQIVDQAEQDAQLHRARCHFARRPGHTYHLYEGPDGLYWSMLSPDDWGTPPHPHRGSYLLEADQSWTPVD